MFYKDSLYMHVHASGVDTGQGWLNEIEDEAFTEYDLTDTPETRKKIFVKWIDEGIFCEVFEDEDEDGNVTYLDADQYLNGQD